jgi:hypothetical protein
LASGEYSAGRVVRVLCPGRGAVPSARSRASSTHYGAAPQNQDPRITPTHEPRISSASRRKERRDARHPGNAGNTPPHSRGAPGVRVLPIDPHQNKRAQGMPGAWQHPQSRMRMKKAYERSHHRYAEAVRHSLHDGFTTYSTLFPAIGLFCHRRRPRCESIVASLTSASRRQNHVASSYVCARSSVASQASIASRAQRP